MILKSTCFVVTLTFFALPLFAASPYEVELAKLTAQRDKALAQVSEPINRRYQDALNQLMRKAMQSNDLDASIKIRAALAAMGLPAASARFVARWVYGESKSLIRFLPSGSFDEKWEGLTNEGKWQVTSESEAKVTYKSGKVHIFSLSEDGKSIKRLEDGKTWTRGS